MLATALWLALQEATDRYGDPLPKGAVARLGTIRLRHEPGIIAIRFSNDGESVLSVGYDLTVRAWDVKTGAGREVMKLEKELNGPLCAAWSADGKLLAVGWHDGPVHLYDVETGKRRFRAEAADAPIHAIAVTEDGTFVVSADADGKTKVWNAESGAMTRELSMGGWSAVALAGSSVVSGSDAVVRWEAATGTKAWTYEEGEQVHGLAATPDGGRVVLSSNNVILLDGADGTKIAEIETMITGGICASRDWFAHASNDSIYVHSARDGKEIRSIPIDRHMAARHPMASSPDGTMLAVATESALEIFDVEAGSPHKTFEGHPGGVRSVRYAPDGASILTGGYHDDFLRVWDATTGEHRRSVRTKGETLVVGASADGKVFVSEGASHHVDYARVFVWDPARPDDRREVRCRPAMMPERFAVSPDGTTLVIAGSGRGGGSRRVSAFSLADGVESFMLDEYKWFVQSLAYLPSGRWFVTGEQRGKTDNPGSIWDSATGEIVGDYGEPGHGPIYGVATTSQMLGAAYGNGDVQIWEIASRGLVRTIKASGDPSIDWEGTPISFAAGGRLLLWVESKETLRCWDTALEKEIEALRVPARTFDVAPDGRHVAVATGTAVMVYAVPELEPIPKADLDASIAALGAKDAAAAMRAAWRLGDDAIDRLVEFGTPPAVEDPAGLIRRLDSEDVAERDAAADALRKMDVAVAAPLQAALEGSASPEAKERVRRLLKEMSGPFASSDLSLRQRRIVAVLERIGSERAKAALRECGWPAAER